MISNKSSMLCKKPPIQVLFLSRSNLEYVENTYVHRSFGTIFPKIKHLVLQYGAHAQAHKHTSHEFMYPVKLNNFTYLTRVKCWLAITNKDLTTTEYSTQGVKLPLWTTELAHQHTSLSLLPGRRCRRRRKLSSLLPSIFFFLLPLSRPVLPDGKLWSTPFLGLHQDGGQGEGGGAIQGKEGIKFCSEA